MLNVALTGNVASGKSAVADRWRSLGVPVISADELAREAVEAGSEGLRQVVEAFGDEVLAADGRLDRDRMREIVFRDDAARKRLEEIIHPIVWRLRDDWLNRQRAGGASLAVSEIPLLFETGREGDFDAVVLVDAPVEVRVGRMVENRDLAPDEARRMADAQMDASEKRPRADFVIDNVATLPDLEVLADRVLAELRARAKESSMKVDLHLHTHGSRDCLSDPEAVLERALELGYHRIAITDHDRVHVALEMAEKHPDRIIPGEEVKTAEGIDVIGL
ncbi:MAG: dephospho-CoA kinase, partial [Longimicrobiales bacterium]|nr:dephospho-CoA kinase [Longimicrobiales bacterium]